MTEAKRPLITANMVTFARLSPMPLLAFWLYSAATSRPAMAATKRIFHEAADLPLDEALERGRELNQRMRGFKKP